MIEAPKLGRSELDEFEALFKNHHARLVRFAMAMGASLEQARDVAQEAFIALYGHWGEVKAPEAFLRTVCRRRLIDDWRRQTYAAEPMGDITALQLHEEAAQQSDLSTALTVLDHIRKLPLRQRSVMALSVDGFTPSEIAEILDIAPTSARANLHFARKALRQSLSDQGVFPDVGDMSAT